ncbi:MAG: hypothetical protein V4850_19170 [Myxococcota bacterium]
MSKSRSPKSFSAKSLWILAIPLVLAACQKSPEAYEGYGGAPPEADDQQGTNGEMGPPGTDGFGQQGTDGFGQQGRPDVGASRPGVPPAVNELQQYVAQLRGAGDMQYTDIAQALRNVAAAYRALPNASPSFTDQVTKIESYADRIEAAGATSDMQARWVKRALTESVDALDQYGKEQNLTGMDERTRNVREQVDQLVEDQPFTAQKDVFVNALSQLSDTLVQYSVPRQQPGTE